jgi:hypothetical protein
VPLDAVRLAGLLADDDRRRVFAALVLGAADTAGVASAAGLELARAGKALSRLAEAGLVMRQDDGRLTLHVQAFGAAARAERPAVTPSRGDPSEAVLARFLRDGRLLSIPATRDKRLVVLAYLAQEFEPGRHYSESMVNVMLGRWHADAAALRRYLVDEGFLDRAAGEYWRAGGPVPL